MGFITRFNQYLEGQPEIVLTVLLLSISTVGILVALKGQPALKAFFVAYFLLP